MVVTAIFPMVYGGHYHDLYPQYRVFSIVLPVVTKDFSQGIGIFWSWGRFSQHFQRVIMEYRGLTIFFVCFPVLSLGVSFSGGGVLVVSFVYFRRV